MKKKGNEANVIVSYVAAGKDLLSDEGKKLILEADRADIKDAALDKKAFLALLSLREKSQDVNLRRKIMLALSG